MVDFTARGDNFIMQGENLPSLFEKRSEIKFKNSFFQLKARSDVITQYEHILVLYRGSFPRGFV
jgi:hypothetical protein